jgi:hypothetical protein
MRIAPLARWLARTSPATHRALRRPWRAIRPYLPIDDAYWRERQAFNYYADVVRLSRQYVPDGGSVIDVGAGATHVLGRLDWFADRVALDLKMARRQRGIERVRGDFLAYRADRSFDLVLCLQVLEHLNDPTTFARKLFATGRTVIISVPYRWPAGLYPPHVQDPVDEDSLAAWTGRTPTETQVALDGLQRLIAVYSANR